MPLALVVTDSTWVANDVRSALTFGDWGIEEASDPRKVVERIEELKPDVVIVDLQVGSKGGMAIIRAIRSAFPDGNAPRTVLLLDRSADQFIARRAMADASVVKPYTSAVLRAAIHPTPAVSPASLSVGEEEE